MDRGGRHAAELGPLLHGVLRLHARRPRRGGRDLDRAAAARDRPAGRHHPRLPDADGPPAARARRRGRRCCAPDLIGPGDQGVVQDPEAIAIMFDTMRRGRPGAVRPGTTIEWDFTDAAPWHLALDNGASRAVQGRAPHADLTLRLRLPTGPTSSPAARTRGADAAPAAAAEGEPAGVAPAAEGLRLTLDVRDARRGLNSIIEGGVSRSRSRRARTAPTFRRYPTKTRDGSADRPRTRRRPLPSLDDAVSGRHKRPRANRRPTHHKLARCRAMDEQGTSPGGVTRRRLIRAAALTAATTALPARAQAATKPKASAAQSATADVVVVGAGLAGLTAARDLVAAGRCRRPRGARPRGRARAQRRPRQRRHHRGRRRVHRPHPGPHRRPGQGRGRRHLPDLQHRRQHLLPRRDGHPLQLVGPARPGAARPHGRGRGREGDPPARRHGQDDPARRAVDGGAGQGVGLADLRDVEARQRR